jgi:transcriptional regulator with XRE-family HTH domain
MASNLDPGRLVREARSRAGLSQRELASRAGTSQSVVARIESGQTRPGSAILNRLLEAAGFDLRTELVPLPVVDTHMLEDVARILALTPEQRLREVANVSGFESAARRAR